MRTRSNTRQVEELPKDNELNLQVTKKKRRRSTSISHSRKRVKLDNSQIQVNSIPQGELSKLQGHYGEFGYSDIYNPDLDPDYNNDISSESGSTSSDSDSTSNGKEADLERQLSYLLTNKKKIVTRSSKINIDEGLEDLEDLDEDLDGDLTNDLDNDRDRDLEEYLNNALEGRDTSLQDLSQEEMEKLKEKLKDLAKLNQESNPSITRILNSNLSSKDKVKLLEYWSVYQDSYGSERRVYRKLIQDFINTHTVDAQNLQSFEKEEQRLQKIESSREPTKGMIINANLTTEDKLKALQMFEYYSQNHTTRDIFERYQQKKDLFEFITSNAIPDLEEFKKIEAEEKRMRKKIMFKRSFKARILELDTSQRNKQIIFEKYLHYSKLSPSDDEAVKLYEYLDFICNYPWGKFDQPPVNFKDNTPAEIQDYLIKCRQNLDTKVSFMDNIKSEFLDLVSETLTNPTGTIKAIGLIGPPGVGKTKLIIEGLAKPLGRKLGIIAVGGERDGSIFSGNQNVYIGSEPGRPIELQKELEAENIVIYVDELDKMDLGIGEDGGSLTGVITRLIDTTQNHLWHDKKYYGIDFSMKNVLFIFSYNDRSKIDQILGNRVHEFVVEGYTSDQKNIIARDHIVPEIEEEVVGFKPGQVILGDPNAALQVLDKIQSMSKLQEKGLRQFYRNIETIYKRINTIVNVMKGNQEKIKQLRLPYQIPSDCCKFPFILNIDIVEALFYES